jgi:glycosidase
LTENKNFRAFCCGFLTGLLVVAGAGRRQVAAQEARDVSKDAARQSRAWVRDGVVYEIFPRVFSEAGNFNGVTSQLDRLRDLGVTILWLMPVHPTGQEKKKGSIGSPYAVRDYYAINPDYGTKDDLKRLVAEAHRRGMKVIIDIVANHTAWDSVLMRTPAFYTRDAGGKILAPDAGWTDVADLNYDNPALREYMLEMLKHWLREFDLDGFRCDVSWLVPTDFWERARAELERIKPDIIMLSESNEPEHLVRAFDLNYAWPFFHAVNDVVRGKAAATHLRATWEAERARHPRGAMQLRFTDNHDERRAVARLGERGSMAAAALVLTLDGVPLVYNGMEVGDTMESGDPALFEKFPIFWPIVRRNPQLPVFYRQLIALRRAHPALRQGDVQWIRNSGESHVVAYTRREGREEFLIAINFSNQPFVGFVEATNAPAPFVEVTPDPNSPSEIEPKERPAALPALSLGAWECRIFRRQK